MCSFNTGSSPHDLVQQNGTTEKIKPYLKETNLSKNLQKVY